MSRQIPYTEYRRRVFNTALLEALSKPYLMSLGENTLKGEDESYSYINPNTLSKVVNKLYGGRDNNTAYKPDESLSDKIKKRRIAARNEAASQPALVSNGAAEAAPTNPDGSDKKASEKNRPLNSCGPEDMSMCESMCNHYFTEELNLNESSIDQTKARLADANYYVVEACEECEVIAKNAEGDAREQNAVITDDQTIELSPADHEVLDQLFHVKGPGPQIDQIRDATVKALIAEEKKSQEVKDALDLANAKVSAGDPNAYNETADRISQIGPTSLMGAIMNNMSRAAIMDVNESGRFTSIGDAMQENADAIKTRSVMLYALMETGNQLEITHYSNKDVERLARDIFYQK